MTEEIEKKVSLVVQEFHDDLLFTHINDDYDAKELLSIEDVFFQKINFQKTYSTNQAAELLDRELTYAKSKTQALVNYLQRPDFQNYLGQAKRNGRYRYDWKLLFKMRMIFYLSNHGLRPSDISEILGETATVEIYNNNINHETTRPKAPATYDPEIISNLKIELMHTLFDGVGELLKLQEQSYSIKVNEKVAEVEKISIEKTEKELEYRKNTLEQNKQLLESINKIQEKTEGGLFTRFMSKFTKPNDESKKILTEVISNMDKDIELMNKELDDAQKVKKELSDKIEESKKFYKELEDKKSKLDTNSFLRLTASSEEE